MSKIVTFGEIMGRISPENFQRFSQCMPGKMDLTFAGAEANVAAAIALLGGDVEFVTALPNNDIVNACLRNLHSIDVHTDNVIKVENGRIGLFFVERGANQRPSKVIYDRENSAVTTTRGENYNWDEIFKDAKWLHVTGITPALSEISANATELAVRIAKEKGLTVSCDLNFRNKLWKWQSTSSSKVLANKTMTSILPFVDLVIGNEEDADDVFGIHAPNSDVKNGELDADKYIYVAREIVKRFPNVKKVAITLRESLSATHNNWGALLYSAKLDKAFMSPVIDGKYTPYQIKNIVDRVGGGDSFCGSLIYALNDSELNDPQKAISFAVAASCLAHSINGDYNYVSRTEVESLMRGSTSGRVIR